MILQPGQFSTQSLHSSPAGEDICRILAAAVNSADAGEAIRKAVYRQENRLYIAGAPILLDRYRRIMVIGAGKAAVPMADALAGILGDRITSGLLITKIGHLAHAENLSHSRISIVEANHPIPDQSNLEASSLLVPMLHDLSSSDLVICLLSGGGSALMMLPSPGIPLDDLQRTTQVLLDCGAEIGEINTIRKHLDGFKGGGLAKRIYPASLVSLILSDVVGDHLDQIASGPTVADPTTYQEAWAIFNRYHILPISRQADHDHRPFARQAFHGAEDKLLVATATPRALAGDGGLTAGQEAGG